ncbi:MAG: hypothetical protein IPN29_05775 [Saprospiraceae bacterium]|nr:hypothetical protein [Saprospiraceae bacterium]
MKTLFSFICLVIFCMGTPTNYAQTAAAPKQATRFTEYSYMKVMPGKEDEYIKLEKAWKKIHLAKKKAGQIDDWSFSRVISPSGSSAEYDFVTRNTFLGEDMYAAVYTDNYFPANWQSMLTVDEIDLVLRTGEIRTMVKSETFVVRDEVWADDSRTNAKLFVVNFFNVPEGKTSEDHAKVEMDIWKPVHAARVKAGTMKGWSYLEKMLPFGSLQRYNSITIDGYTDMRQYLNPWSDDYFKAAHPGKDMAAMLKQTSDSCILVRGEVRMMVDRLSW